MRIAVTRSGGFAGLVRRGEGDTVASPELAELADRAGVASLPGRLTDAAVGAEGVPRAVPAGRPDAFSYAISLDGADPVQVPEHLLEGPLRELVETVLAGTSPSSARPGPPPEALAPDTG